MKDAPSRNRTPMPDRLPDGFRFSGVVSGLRSEPNRRDVGAIVSDRPATAAGVYTQNVFAAAPVQLCRERLSADGVRGLIVCSGNANACTGEQGLADAREMTKLLADAIDAPEKSVVVCSTGVIGRLLPMPVVREGVRQSASALAATDGSIDDFAASILTTDTRIKVSSRDVMNKRDSFKLLGIAKGAAMIGPNMATMLGFLVTDAPVRADDLQTILRDAARDTFNCISVEGHTSTNDTVLVFANGAGEPLSGDDLESFAGAVREVCGELARMIAADAEGADHLIIIDVEGCRNDAEARQLAKTVADSPLVKTAVHGADPNWGRFVSAAGYSGVKFAESDLELWMGPMHLFADGQPLSFDPKTASDYLRQNREVTLRFRLPFGKGKCRFYSCDLTAEYVRLNADYTT